MISAWHFRSPTICSMSRAPPARRESPSDRTLRPEKRRSSRFSVSSARAPRRNCWYRRQWLILIYLRKKRTFCAKRRVLLSTAALEQEARVGFRRNEECAAQFTAVGQRSVSRGFASSCGGRFAAAGGGAAPGAGRCGVGDGRA